MKINEFIRKYNKVKTLVPGITSSFCPYVICKDGFKMSVQVGQSNYSTPKDNVNNYEEAEVGYPSEEETLIARYAEDSTRLCDTVYGFVPCTLIDRVIEKHGGIDEEKSTLLSK